MVFADFIPKTFGTVIAKTHAKNEAYQFVIPRLRIYSRLGLQILNSDGVLELLFTMNFESLSMGHKANRIIIWEIFTNANTCFL